MIYVAFMILLIYFNKVVFDIWGLLGEKNGTSIMLKETKMWFCKLVCA